jgi:hypothetical protein
MPRNLAIGHEPREPIGFREHEERAIRTLGTDLVVDGEEGLERRAVGRLVDVHAEAVHVRQAVPICVDARA